MRLILLFASAIAIWGAEGDKLAVSSIALHNYDGGPPIASDFDFLPGDNVFLTFRVAGLKLVEKGRDRKEFFHLTYEIETVDPEGVPLREKVTGEMVAEVTPQDKKKEWTPLVRYDVGAPQSAPSGNYPIRIRVKDVQAETAMEEVVSFSVEGRRVEPSDTLVVRNFRFLRSETAMRPLQVPAYRPGDTVWARFDMTGYEFGEGNSFHVNYGLSVLRSSGEELFTQEVAADERRESFYPQRHIPGSLSLNLTDDLAKDEYTIVVTVRDLLGDQIYETKQVFFVE